MCLESYSRQRLFVQYFPSDLNFCKGYIRPHVPNLLALPRRGHDPEQQVSLLLDSFLALSLVSHLHQARFLSIHCLVASWPNQSSFRFSPHKHPCLYRTHGLGILSADKHSMAADGCGSKPRLRPETRVQCVPACDVPGTACSMDVTKGGTRGGHRLQASHQG